MFLLHVQICMCSNARIKNKSTSVSSNLRLMFPRYLQIFVDVSNFHRGTKRMIQEDATFRNLSFWYERKSVNSRTSKTSGKKGYV